MDVDEADLRAGTHLAAPARLPAGAGRARAGAGRQGAHGAGEASAQASIAAHVVERLLGDGPVLVGPWHDDGGDHGRPRAAQVAARRRRHRGGRLVLPDAEEEELLRFASPAARIVRDAGRRAGLHPRPRQPAAVAARGQGDRPRPAGRRRHAREADALAGRPLLVDTGDAALDEELAGFHRVVTAYGRETVHRVGVVAPSRTWRDASHESRTVTFPPQFVAFPRRDHRTMFL